MKMVTEEEYAQLGKARLVTGVLANAIELLKNVIDSGDSAKVNQASAIYAFVAWLSTRPEPVTIGSNHDCAPLPPLIDEFCKSQGFAPVPDDFPKALKPYPLSQPFYKTILTPRTTAAIEEAGPLTAPTDSEGAE